MPMYKKRHKLRNTVWIFTHHLDHHAFLTSFKTKFPYHDRFLESINRANRRILVNAYRALSPVNHTSSFIILH